MHTPRIVVLSPPFYSHFAPLLALSRALASTGAAVIVGCTDAFAPQIRDAGLGFAEVQINRNANTGRAAATRQAVEEAARLREFFEATRRGPVATLRTQMQHRFADMLANPEELIERISELHDQLRPDLWIVDQLSYGVTLALVAHGLRFATFCPPHPLSISGPGALPGVPPHWPKSMTVDRSDLAELHTEAAHLQIAFTERFNELLAPFGRRVEDAFGRCSSELVLYNYPDIPHEERVTTGPMRAHCGYSFVDVPPEPSGASADREGQPSPESGPRSIVVALGTFLSARDDVLVSLAGLLRRRFPNASIAVGAGEHVDAVRAVVGEPSVVEPFIPQHALLRDADLVIHHGGVSSFTESLYYGVPMIVMPFSSDQFNVACDVERTGMGAVLDPNALTQQELNAAIECATSPRALAALRHYHHQVRSRGPAWAAQRVRELL